jgi:hypothetical protein
MAGLSARRVKGRLTAGCKPTGMLWPSTAQSRRKNAVAAPNYSYEKRQRELAKKRKQEEKRNKKANPQPDGGPGVPDPAEGSVPGDLPPGTAAPSN